MLKPHHAIAFTTIVIITAAVSAFSVNRILSSLLITDRPIPTVSNLKSPPPSTYPTPSFPMNRDGVYILPSVDPANPIKPGNGTVGGNTACERLDNLKKCLENNKSTLAAQVLVPQVEAGVSIESLCGNRLNDLQSIRLQTIQAGCVW
jgi:hypothetical protein